MRRTVELEDVESAIYALKQAQEPMVKFSLDQTEVTARAIVAMQTGIKQALKCLERICQEANNAD